MNHEKMAARKGQVPDYQHPPNRSERLLARLRAILERRPYVEHTKLIHCVHEFTPAGYRIAGGYMAGVLRVLRGRSVHSLL